MPFGNAGWIQANTDTRNNPELDQPGGAWRQLKYRVVGTAITLAIVLVVVAFVGLASG